MSEDVMLVIVLLLCLWIGGFIGAAVLSAESPSLRHAFDAFSGEWMLKRSANGGRVVFARAVLVTSIVYGVSLLVRLLLLAKADSSFTWEFIQEKSVDTLPWIAAIFAAVFAGLYSRFASQWSYLATTYNDYMSARMQTPINNGQADPFHHRTMKLWEAAFVEDDYDLHLWRKRMFAPLVRELLQDVEVEKIFKESTHDGVARLREIQAALRF
jgi:hypothetical protein